MPGALAKRTPSARESQQAQQPAPIDPQTIQDQDDMTWSDYKPIPGIDWADPTTATCSVSH